MEPMEFAERSSRGEILWDTVSEKEIKVIGGVDCMGNCFAITSDEGKMIRVNANNLEPISEKEIPSVSKSVERESFGKITTDNGYGPVIIYENLSRSDLLDILPLPH